MTEEAKNDSAAAAGQPEETAKAPEKKRGLPKYVIFGGGGLVAVIVIGVVLMMLLGGKKEAQPVEAEAEPKAAVTDTVSHEAKPPEVVQEAAEADMEQLLSDSAIADLDLGLDASDTSVLSMIQNSLDFLDSDATAGEIANENDASPHMSKKDSLDAVNWLDKEKASLAKREKDLQQREDSLRALDKKVSQKLTVLEQAESARIASLAKLYDGMDSRSVALLMANLDDATVVAIIPRMKQKNASSVLSLMPAPRAARLSKQMITIAEN